MSATAELEARPGISGERVRLAAAVYSADDIADLLTISKRQVWRLRDAGLLPGCIRIGQAAVRWRRAEIDEWIAQGCPKPKSR
jgi:predicted DNA-binding transcriptional regulator AlpA